MSTFSQDKINARGDQAAVDKDNPTAEEIAADENTTGQESIPRDGPEQADRVAR
jgi:hypothetical protein